MISLVFAVVVVKAMHSLPVDVAKCFVLSLRALVLSMFL